MRSPQSLAAIFAAVWGVSSVAAPTNTSKPGSLMAPTTRRSTTTLAWPTRCTTARTRIPFRRRRRQQQCPGPVCQASVAGAAAWLRPVP